MIVPVARACRASASDAVTEAAPSMDASVVATITGIAVVVPVIVVPSMPSAVAVTTVLVAASSVTAPPAATVVLPARRARAVVLMVGDAMATSPATGTVAGSVTVASTFDVAVALNPSAAVMLEAPRTVISADTLAASAAAGTLGSALVTSE
ncbi:MAG TPA: hypothetical protein VIL25_01050, partial [Vicinamibacterales bacterium]